MSSDRFKSKKQAMKFHKKVRPKQHVHKQRKAA